MKPNTKKFLMELENADWFNNSGKIVGETREVKPIEGWSQAISISSTEQSEHAQSEALAELTVFLSACHSERYQSWNALVKGMKPLIARIIREKLASPPISARLPADSEHFFLQTLNWDLLCICMAHEHRDIISTRYYELMEYWYLAGHFPCGWVGEVPENMENAFHVGKLAVF